MRLLLKCWIAAGLWIMGAGVGLGAAKPPADTIVYFVTHVTTNDITKGADPATVGQLRGDLLWPSAKYGLRIARFGEPHLTGFPEAMAKAKILIIGAKAGSAAARTIFKDPPLVAAVNEFLKGGGVLFFQYMSSDPASEYLTGIGVTPPSTPTHFSGYNIEVAPASKSDPLLNEPYPLTNNLPRQEGGLGWWEKWPEACIPLLVPSGQPQFAALLIQRHVLGQGSVIFCQVTSIISDKLERYPLLSQFVLNLYRYAFDPLTEVIKEISYPSSADGSSQPALWYAPSGTNPAPLLVALHEWSADYKTGASDGYARECIDRGWAFIFPNFRGPNLRPEACASELVVKDILSAVDYARTRTPVDPRRIYLAGCSGGGHAALLMAGRAPEVWAGVSAWAAISDLKAWHAQCSQSAEYARYACPIEACCGGKPGNSPQVDEAYRQRSPLTHLPRAGNLPLDINAGIHDGHRGSVPVSHSLRAFNSVAAQADRLADTDIDAFVTREAVPPALIQPLQDPAYGDKPPLFRRASNKVRITIFDGGHEIILPAALSWLEQQVKP